jgi:uncharacterized SAM-binding protein YcdF (DUF218 family)
LTDFINGVFTGAGAAVTFLTVVVWLVRRPRSTAARRAAVVIAAGYVLASIFIVPHAIGWVLFTRGYHPFLTGDAPIGRIAVVLLGGGADTVHGFGGTTLAVPSGDGLERVLEAARVFNLTHADWLISSGGTLDPRRERDGVTMRDQLVRIGVPPERVIVESESRTTHEQAVLVSPILRSLGATGVVLVTSDIHMPRSIGAFRAYGVQAVPAIAPSTHASDAMRKRVLPSAEGLSRSQAVSHEMLGLMYYAVRGWWIR